jgi:hypothetical protein
MMRAADVLRTRLRDWLRTHDHSARWLSIQAGVSENTVNRFISGGVRNLRPENWRRVCAVVGWDPNAVLGSLGYEPPVPPPDLDDPASEIDRILQRAGASEEGRQAAMWVVRRALPAAEPGRADSP